MFLKFLQNSQENTCARVSSLIKLQCPGPRYRSFLVNLAKFLKIPFFTKHQRATASVKRCWRKTLSSFHRINQFSPWKILSYKFRHGRSTCDLIVKFEKVFNNSWTIKIIGKKWRWFFKIDDKNNDAWRLLLMSLHVSRKFYIRRNNNNVDSIETEPTVIAHLYL